MAPGGILMAMPDPILRMKLEGPSLAGRIPVAELTLLLSQVQLCIKRLGQALSGEVSGVKPGRLRGEIEAACKLEIVAPLEAGSFTVGLDLSQRGQFLLPWGGEERALGELAAERFVEGLALLGGEEPRLLSEFDYGVLSALREAGRVLNRGVQRVVVDYRARGRTRTAVVDRIMRDRIVQNIAGPVTSAVEVKGWLREVNLERRTCQIFPSVGRFVGCTFEERHEASVKEGLDDFVVAIGEATLRESDGRIRELRIRDIEAFEEPPDLLADQPASKVPLTARALLVSGLPGMWKDRKDVNDSGDFARALRERAEKRGAE